jgi:hypothetical protein
MVTQPRKNPASSCCGRAYCIGVTAATRRKRNQHLHHEKEKIIIVSGVPTACITITSISASLHTIRPQSSKADHFSPPAANLALHPIPHKRSSRRWCDACEKRVSRVRRDLGSYCFLFRHSVICFGAGVGFWVALLREVCIAFRS